MQKKCHSGKIELPDFRVPRIGKLGHISQSELSARLFELPASGKLGYLAKLELSASLFELSASGKLRTFSDQSCPINEDCV